MVLQIKERPMTSIHFQAGVRKANKKIDKLQKKKSSVMAKRLESLQSKAMKRYYKTIDVEPVDVIDFYKGYYVALSYFFYRGYKFEETMEF